MLMTCLHGTDVLVDNDDHGNITADEIFTRPARRSPVQERPKAN